MQEDTIFEMASVNKMFTAAAVMLLVREGKRSLDDEYMKFFPDYPDPSVTVRHASTESYLMMGIHMDEIGMAWITDNENENGFVWHNGGTVPP